MIATHQLRIFPLPFTSYMEQSPRMLTASGTTAIPHPIMAMVHFSSIRMLARLVVCSILFAPH